MLSKVCKIRLVWERKFFFLKAGWWLCRYEEKRDFIVCFVVCNDLDVGRKEEKGQNSSSASVQHFWAISDCGLKAFVTKSYFFFFSVAQSLPGLQCVLSLLSSAFNSCSRRGRIFGS